MQTPSYEEITFTRQEFYDKMWAKPTTKVAKELGISDVMVGKVCKQYKIPKPYLGYWAKLAHGKNPKQTALPKNSNPDLETLTFFKYPDKESTTNEPIPEPVYDDDIQSLLDRAVSLEPVKVAESLRNPHPLIAATDKKIKRNSIPFHQRVYDEPRDSRPTLDIDVSKNCASRALRIMDALVKRIEKIGGYVEVRKEKYSEYNTQAYICFGGLDVTTVRMREKNKQIRLSDEERKKQWKSIDLQPTGLLIIDTASSSYGGGLLKDSPKRYRIEEGLNDFVIELVKQAGRLRIKRREEAEARKRREEEERIRRQQEEELRRRREELAKRQNAERDRVEKLVDHANAWRQSRIIRNYLEAVCNMLIERDGAIAIDGEAAEYLRWALQQADRMDPLRPNAPSILDEKV